MVAHEIGLSHLRGQLARGARRIVSEDSSGRIRRPFLLIVRTGRIVTATLPWQVAPDTRGFQHIAEFYNYLG